MRSLNEVLARYVSEKKHVEELYRELRVALCDHEGPVTPNTTVGLIDTLVDHWEGFIAGLEWAAGPEASLFLKEDADAGTALHHSD
jgi:hypothetical protein